MEEQDINNGGKQQQEEVDSKTKRTKELEELQNGKDISRKLLKGGIILAHAGAVNCARIARHTNCLQLDNSRRYLSHHVLDLF